jgi:AmmeMemoRadiSam system protein A
MLDPDSQVLLLDLACDSITTHLQGPYQLPPEVGTLPAVLRSPGACFVTLKIDHALRGCCGSIEARRPLALDAWHNAQASAFHDPRFAPLSSREWPRTDVEISVLSEMTPRVAADERILIETLRPGRDGLLIAFGEQRATFLPAVWEQIATADEFLARLKHKAGWPAGFWHRDMQAWTYETESFSRSAADRALGPAR